MGLSPSALPFLFLLVSKNGNGVGKLFSCHGDVLWQKRDQELCDIAFNYEPKGQEPQMWRADTMEAESREARRHIVAEAEVGRQVEWAGIAEEGGVKTCLINGFGFLKERKEEREEVEGKEKRGANDTNCSCLP